MGIVYINQARNYAFVKLNEKYDFNGFPREPFWFNYLEIIDISKEFLFETIEEEL